MTRLLYTFPFACRAAAPRDHVAGAEAADGDVMDETGAEIKVGEQVVRAAEGDAMMAVAILVVARAGGFQHETIHGVERAADERSTVRIDDAHVPHPAMRNAAQRHGVEAQFREVPLVRRQRILEREILHAAFGNGRREGAQLRLPFRLQIATQWPVQCHAVAGDRGDAADQGHPRATFEVLHRPGITAIQMHRQRVVRRVGLIDLDLLSHAQSGGRCDGDHLIAALRRAGDVRQFL